MGKPLLKKLADNIFDSNFILVFWTKNVANNPKTRDIVIWEITHGNGLGKAIIAFVDMKQKPSLIINHVTTYYRVNFATKRNVINAMKRFISQNLKLDEEVYREFAKSMSKYKFETKAFEEILSKYGYTKEKLKELIEKCERQVRES